MGTSDGLESPTTLTDDAAEERSMPSEQEAHGLEELSDGMSEGGAAPNTTPDVTPIADATPTSDVGPSPDVTPSPDVMPSPDVTAAAIPETETTLPHADAAPAHDVMPAHDALVDTAPDSTSIATPDSTPALDGALPVQVATLAPDTPPAAPSTPDHTSEASETTPTPATTANASYEAAPQATEAAPAPAMTVPPADGPAQSYEAVQAEAPPVALAGPTLPLRRKRGLRIVLAIAAVALLLSGGLAAYTVVQREAPDTAARQFCGALTARDYAAAYALFAGNLRAQYSQAQFSQDAAALDQAEGQVVSCAPGPWSSLAYSSDSGLTAQQQTMLTRAVQGRLSGTLQLAFDSGRWKITALDSALFGINLDALQAASDYCAALRGHDAAATYALLAGPQQARTTETNFTQNAQLHDQVDGQVQECDVTAILPGNSDTSASVMMRLARSRLGARSGPITLTREGGRWKVASLDSALQGSDLRPVALGTQFCADLSAGRFSAAYDLTSSDFRHLVSRQDFTTVFAIPGFTWSGCADDYGTYAATTSSASYDTTLMLLNTQTGQTARLRMAISFVYASGAWAIDTLRFLG